MKHALLIGIGYVNTPDELKGPLTDVYKIKNTLVGYESVIITDHTELKPTKKVILEAFRNLLAQKGTLFFYYSGHGIETPESILCADSEIITHTEFREMLQTMDKDSTLISVVDTCYSGDLFDLSHKWATDFHDKGSDTPGHVYLISSSKEDELSLEYLTRTGGVGAFTSAYLNTIQRPQTWNSLLDHISDQLIQTPVLTTGQYEDLDQPYVL
jgi:hypothetical protein